MKPTKMPILLVVVVAVACLVQPMPGLAAEPKSATPSATGPIPSKTDSSRKKSTPTPTPTSGRKAETKGKESNYTLEERTHKVEKTDMAVCPAAIKNKEGKICRLYKSKLYQGILYCTYKCVVIGPPVPMDASQRQ